jgi:hypothetical protein
MALATADVDDVPGCAGFDPRGQIEEGPVAFGGEAAVLRGIPSHGLTLTARPTG